MARKSRPATVLAGVEAAVRASGEVSWRTTLAVTLAGQIDLEPNASMARELRALMAAIESDVVPEDVGDVADDLRARRARRIAGADDGKLAAGGDVGG